MLARISVGGAGGAAVGRPLRGFPPAGLWTLPPLPPPGPFGERDDRQVFLQKVVPDANKLYVRLSSTGKR